MSTQTSRTGAALEDAVVGLIKERGGLARDEIVVHFDLVAMTRDGSEGIERRYWCTPGSDPHYSWGVLSAQAAKIQQEQL